MSKFIIRFSDERLITPTGISLVGQILAQNGFFRVLKQKEKGSKRSGPHISDGDILLSFVGLLCQGKTDFEAVREFHGDPDFYKKALGISRIPSEPILRQRMDAIGSSLRPYLLRVNTEMFYEYGIKPSALNNGKVPVDMDVTPFDNSKTKKEGVSRTYKGFDGYAPMMAYIGTEGYLANAELRIGKQHCQNGTPEFLKETLESCHRMTDAPLLVRLDSGNDAAENIGILIDDGTSFIIKRNLRGAEKPSDWLEYAKKNSSKCESPREGKTVYTGTTSKTIEYMNPEAQTAEVSIVYEIIERTISRDGQYLLVPDIECNTFWSNTGWDAETVIQSYHAHGECEQYHSEIKSDMDVERLPSGKFETNELVLELTILAYNILRMIGQESLRSPHAPKSKHPVKRRRLRTVISNLILIASHVIDHSRISILSLGRSNIWRHAFADVYKRFAIS